MTLHKSALALGVFVLAGLASAASMDLNQPAWVGQTQLKAGHYKIEVEGNKAVFKSGRQSVEVPVTVDNAAKKFNMTSIESTGNKIETIHLGGTTTSITIKPSATAPTAAAGNGGTGL